MLKISPPTVSWVVFCVFSGLATSNTAAQQQFAPAELKPFAEVCRMERRVRIPVDDGTQYPSLITSATVDDRGRLYLADIGGESAFVVDSTGRPLQRIGKRGRGPGEFQSIQQVHRARSGRLYVLDQVGMRIGILDSTGRELRRFPTLRVGGRRMVLVDDSIAVVSGHYSGKNQVVAYAPNGDVLWTKVPLPEMLATLRPRLDLSFISALPDGRVIAGSGLVPELWLATATSETRIPLQLAGRWQQLESLRERRGAAARQGRVIEGSLISDVVTVGKQTVAFSFGKEMALVNLQERKTWVLRDSPGIVLAAARGRLLVRLAPGEEENELRWYACGMP